jgi:hypothetical protein
MLPVIALPLLLVAVAADSFLPISGTWAGIGENNDDAGTYHLVASLEHCEMLYDEPCGAIFYDNGAGNGTLFFEEKIDCADYVTIEGMEEQLGNNAAGVDPVNGNECFTFIELLPDADPNFQVGLISFNQQQDGRLWWTWLRTRGQQVRAWASLETVPAESG